jgi:hypothetical protein
LFDHSKIMTNDDITSNKTKPTDVSWLYVQIALVRDATTASQAAIDPHGWTPWKHRKGDDIEQLCRIALHRFLRTSGYLNGMLPSSPPLTVQVTYYTEDTPLHPSGIPKRVNITVYVVHSTGKE